MATNERELLKAAYPGKGWKEKVDRMTDEQVIAIYKRLHAQRKV